MNSNDLTRKYERAQSSAEDDVHGGAMTPLEWVILLSRVTMETGIVVGFGAWAYQLTNSMAAKIGLTIAVPAVAFGVWGLIDFRRAGRLAEPLRLVQELVISGAAALSAYAAGWHAFGIALGALSVGYHALVYGTARRLLK
ncbi:MAG: YrdB family protein [Dehalococcoidia bacterium]